jgi:hypothetical protein
MWGQIEMESLRFMCVFYASTEGNAYLTGKLKHLRFQKRTVQMPFFFGKQNFISQLLKMETFFFKKDFPLFFGIVFFLGHFFSRNLF